MDEVRPIVALWNPRHVDHLAAEEVLGVLRQGPAIVGAARRAERTGDGILTYRHGLCSVSHETSPQKATRLGVQLADAAAYVRVPAVSAVDGWLRQAPDGDPDPARFAIAALDTVIAAMAAFADPHASFDHDDPSNVVAGILDGAERAGVLAGAVEGCDVIPRSPWSSACVATGHWTTMPLGEAAAEQFDALPTLFCVQRYWIDTETGGTTEHHVELSAYGFPIVVDDVVRSLRLAGRPTIRPRLSTLDE